MACLFTSEVTESFKRACEDKYLDTNISNHKGVPFTIRELRDLLLSMNTAAFSTRKIYKPDLVVLRLPTIDGVQRFLQQSTVSAQVRAVAIFSSPDTLTAKAVNFIDSAKDIALHVNSTKATQDILLDAMKRDDTESNRRLRKEILVTVLRKMQTVSRKPRRPHGGRRGEETKISCPFVGR